MGEKVLVTIELRFTTDDDPDALGERIREATSLIVGRQELEDFRVRALPHTPPKGPRPS
jgi:predicted component of type VI protein secretion system